VGVIAAYVMDYGSTDGSVELMHSAEWRDFVRLVPFPGLDADLSSDRTMSLARERHPDGYCLFCDPDEFLHTQDISVRAMAEAERWDEYSAISLPRINMTAGVATLPVLQLECFRRCLNLAIVRPHARGMEEILTGDLTSPWIFTAIPAKVAVRLRDCSSVGRGDHTATTVGNTRKSSLAWLQHYPIRTWVEFEQKVRQVSRHMECGAGEADLGPGHCWHWRRWVQQLHRGELRPEYERQFVREDVLSRYFEDGTLRAVGDVNERAAASYPARPMYSPMPPGPTGS
jgi:hypothetical protein